MKRIITISLLLLILISSAAAQYTLGVKGGLNLSKDRAGLKVLDEMTTFKPGVHIGIFGRYNIQDKWAVQAEMFYSQQGLHYKDGEGIFFDEIHSLPKGISTHYLNIPILARYDLGKLFYIEAGPQLGFCLDAKYIFKERDSTKEYSIKSKELGLDPHTVDFSLAGGIGMYISHKGSLNLRYNHGFTNTLNHSQWKNRLIQLSLTYDLWSF